MKEGYNIQFTSDTHFDSERALHLSKRPFTSTQHMNECIINNQNSVITKNDIVYHLGDFGNFDYIKYLNGKIKYFIAGNYDKDIKTKLYSFNNCYLLKNEYNLVFDNFIFSLIHEPSNIKSNIKDVFYLFGHIHKLQMIKRNGLNVGIDCHNYTPISLETVLFYKTAIEKHYDHNVFIDYIK